MWLCCLGVIGGSQLKSNWLVIKIVFSKNTLFPIGVLLSCELWAVVGEFLCCRFYYFGFPLVCRAFSVGISVHAVTWHLPVGQHEAAHAGESVEQGTPATGPSTALHKHAHSTIHVPWSYAPQTVNILLVQHCTTACQFIWSAIQYMLHHVLNCRVVAAQHPQLPIHLLDCLCGPLHYTTSHYNTIHYTIQKQTLLQHKILSTK